MDKTLTKWAGIAGAILTLSGFGTYFGFLRPLAYAEDVQAVEKKVNTVAEVAQNISL